MTDDTPLTPGQRELAAEHYHWAIGLARHLTPGRHDLRVRVVR